MPCAKSAFASASRRVQVGTRVSAWLLAASVCLLPSPLAAQRALSAADTGIIRVTVLGAESGAPLPYALVAIPELGLERFANEQGRFAFSRLPEGIYTIRARALGYSPVSREISVQAGEPRELSIRLTRIVTHLSAVRVSANWECREPGRPTPDATATLEVFEQLEQNAQRLLALSEQFPHQIDTERRFSMRRIDGRDSVERADTIQVASALRRRYRPGAVVVRSGEGAVLQLPTLLDFADPLFQRNHCFVLRGIDESTGAPLLRLDFKAWSKLRTPDIDGSVYLDTASYSLRRSEVQLTNVTRSFRALRSVTVTTRFIDLRPGLPIAGPINAVNVFQRRSSSKFVAAVEDQIPLRVFFLRTRPDSIGVSGRD